MKKCSRCGNFCALTEFNRNRSRPDGLQTYCRDCCKIANREYRRANPSLFVEYTRRYRLKNAPTYTLHELPNGTRMLVKVEVDTQEPETNQ